MQFDELDLPKDNGATDWMDSARLAGMMVTARMLSFNPRNLMKYVTHNERGTVVAVRHPRSMKMGANNWKNFTRDQLMCLANGLRLANEQGTVRKLYYACVDRGNRAQNIEKDIPGSVKKFPNGPDWLSPSHLGHLKRCAGLESTWFENLWLKLDIWFFCKYTPLDEPNQLLCMCDSAGPEYVQRFKSMNPDWKNALNKYWAISFRDEPELSETLIEYFEKI